MTYSLPDLWVCEECQMIGLRPDAETHCVAEGHLVRTLSREESEGVRVIWAEDEDRCVRCGDPEHDEDGCLA